jgi:hypothetical protein
VSPEGAKVESDSDVGQDGLAKAKQRGWTVVSMQNDFKMVFDL